MGALPLLRLLLEALLRLHGDGRPLPVGQVPPMEVQREDVRGRALAGPLLEARCDAGVLARAVAIATVEDPALVQDDGLDESVLADVGDQLAELRAIHVHEREQGGSGVELRLRERRALVDGWVG